MTSNLEFQGQKGRINGPTIILNSGGYFDFEHPERSSPTIEDVAWALAFEARWAGQCVQRSTGMPVLYSVAQHCCHAAEQAPKYLKYNALMHELGEAFCGDLCGPPKQLCPDYKAMEKRIEKALAERFFVPDLSTDVRAQQELKAIDKRLMATERRDLTSWEGEPWDYIGDAQPFEEVIVPWSSEKAAEVFLDMFTGYAP